MVAALKPVSESSIDVQNQPRSGAVRPLRIGIMLRHLEPHGGVSVYTRQLLKEWAQLESPHTFVLLYRNPALCGMMREAPNMEEIGLPASNILTWDQIAVRRAITKYRLDVLFNPKFSLPLRPPCPSVWVCHGLDWYIMPEASLLRHRLAHRFLVPRYAAQAKAIISVSKVTSDLIVQYLNVPPERIHTVYPGISAAFWRKFSEEELKAERARLKLPDRYVVYSGAVYPPKNFKRLVHAYARVGPRLGVSLVIAGGENRFLSEHEIWEPERLGLTPWVRRLGWVDHESLAAVYAQAEALLLPSTFESVGLPMIEAMATGCPVLTSNRWGTKELAEGAAYLVDPESVDSIADGLERLLTDTSLRQQLIDAGRERAAQFRWDITAQKILAVLEQIAG